MIRELTLRGYECWYKQLFEEFAYVMVNFTRQPDYNELNKYKTSLQEFISSIKLRKLESIDNIRDLLIMKNDMLLLITHIDEMSSPTEMLGGANKSGRKKASKKINKK